MAQVWLPLEALLQGKLPAVCLLTGADGASLREQKVSWVADPTERGSAMTTPGSVAIAVTLGLKVAMVAAAFKKPPSVMGRVPLSDAALSRMAWTRPLSWGVMLGSFAFAVAVAGLTRSGIVLLLALLGAAVTSIAFGVILYGSWAGLALVKREGDRVLLDLPNERAAATIEKSFAKSVDGTAHSVG